LKYLQIRKYAFSILELVNSSACFCFLLVRDCNKIQQHTKIIRSLRSAPSMIAHYTVNCQVSPTKLSFRFTLAAR